MSHSRALMVTDRNGLRGRIDMGSSSQLPGSAQAEVQVVLEGGQRVAVPRSALVEQRDGTYTVAIDLAEIGRQHGGASNRQAGESVVMPVVEERLNVGKERVETGKVLVTKKVNEREEVVNQPLQAERVEVKHVPVNRPVEGPVAVRHEGNTTIFPILEEVLVVEKRLMLKEEVHVTRVQYKTEKPRRVSLRSEEAEVKRVGSEEQRRDEDHN